MPPFEVALSARLCNRADMDPKSKLESLEKRIAEIRGKLAMIGPMHPGSMSLQYQVCGNPTCRCMNPEKPERHGPYHKLAYVHRGRKAGRFVRADTVEELGRRLGEYKKFRKLMDDWIKLSIQKGVLEFFGPEAKKAAATARRK